MSSTSSKPGPKADVIAVACDHAGYQLKTEVVKLLGELGVQVQDLGCSNPEESVHYPVFGKKVVDSIPSRPGGRGILICGTGLGMSMIANRFPGIRAALCHDVSTAVKSRRHNDANLLVLGGRMIGPQLARDIVQAWLATPFDGGRHQDRLDLMEQLARPRPGMDL
jgi:ribose 5-phosphate isomerase B